jgi:monoamine oxidase
MDRRDFLSMPPALALSGCLKKPPPPAGDLFGPDLALGHALRDGRLPAPSKSRSVPVLIVGGGIAGLSCAWQLQRQGMHDFHLLEMESGLGGNSRSGKTPVSAFPWGAHYVPLANRESVYVRELFADLGILHGDPLAARPHYEEKYLCFSPHERLFEDGLWHETLEPRALDDRATALELRRFRERMQQYRDARGKDGRRAFAIPMDLSSRDPDLLALDQFNMHAWLRAEGFVTPGLHWYVNYACRDDYGTAAADTSAWAGIHYFASRAAEAANAEGETVLTWPEGNGFIARRLAERLPAHAQQRGMAFAMQSERDAIAVAVYLPHEQRSITYRARQVVWAAPLFVAARAWRDAPDDWRRAAASLDYAPWLTATLSLTEPPYHRHGAALAWDNVLYDSPALGYVVATHQSLASRRDGPTVLSYYRPFSEIPVGEARAALLREPWQHWCDTVLADLARPHPEIRHLTERLDVFRNAHAMVRPTPGRLWGGTRERLHVAHPRIQFAHADLSGFSLFEEANYWGVRAALQVTARL